MKHTKEPWDWQRFGQHWCLTGQYGMRPIILSCTTHGPDLKRGLKVLENGLLVPFRPDHPDMRRVVDCVNACAGIQNPAAISDCVDVLKNALLILSGERLSKTDLILTLAEGRAAIEALNREVKP